MAFQRPVRDDWLSFLFADLPENPKDNRVNLPNRSDIVQYLSETRRRTLDELEHAVLDEGNPYLNEGYAWDFALQHECQHQETIFELLQLIQAQGTPSEEPPGLSKDNLVDQRIELVEIPSGSFIMGTDKVCAYDNEQRAHRVDVCSFKLARCQVTASDWMRFMLDGGYVRPELWCSEGWEWKCTEDANCPEYWRTTPGGFVAVGPLGLRAIHPSEPVSSLSWFEAEAYNQWAGMRMPTEEEWEYAASFQLSQTPTRTYPWGDEPPDESRAVHGGTTLGPGPVGSASQAITALGLLDMAGNVWEWTCSRFLPYPGFEAFPYEGYSSDHMKGEHRVCRGGSWATAAPILRCTFRNWYVPTYRQGLLGLRCAHD